MTQLSTTYRSILRLDYPVLYSLVDSLGVYAQYFQEQLSSIPNIKYEVNLNLANRAIRSTVNFATSGEQFTCQLTLSSIVLDVTFQKGYAVSKLAQHAGFKFINDFVAKLNNDGLETFSRIGFRNFFIQERDGVSFNNILEYMIKCNSQFSDTLSNNFSTPNDAAIVFEAKNDENIYLRSTFGPFQISESKKYFPFDAPISEGFIADIDLWQSHMEIKGLKVKEFVINYQKYAGDVFQALCSKVFELVGSRSEK